jgi:hypothetical protein
MLNNFKSKITIGEAEPGVDERGGLPSASGLSRVAACPGSFQMESKSEVTDTSSPAAERGTRVHGVMEGLDIELSPDEELVAKEMMDYDTVLLDCAELIREVRMWYEWTDGERMFSGKIDVGGIDRVTGNTVLVNYKTGQGQEKVEGNWQAMAESLLFHRLFGNEGKSVVYSFNQPESPHGKVKTGTFTEEDLAAFEKKILSALHQSKADNPPLMPSESACRWCKGASICPAANWRVEDASNDGSKPLSKMSTENRSAVLTRQEAAFTLAKSIWDQRKAEARTLLEKNSGGIPGWGLRQGRTITKVNDVLRAYRAAMEKGISEEDFFGSCSISLTKLKGLFGDSKMVEDKLDGAISTSRTMGSIIKK